MAYGSAAGPRPSMPATTAALAGAPTAERPGAQAERPSAEPCRGFLTFASCAATITIITITITIITNTTATTTITTKKGQPSSSPGGVVTGAPGHLSQPRRPIPPPKPSPTIVTSAPIISAIVFVIVITYSTATIVTMSITIIITSLTSSPPS